MSDLPMAYERCSFLVDAAAPLREARLGPRPSAPPWPTGVTDTQPAAMVRVYERNGGLAQCDEVLLLLRRRRSQALSLLAGWIVHRRVVSFEWQGERLLPLFQFDLAAMTIHRSATAVLAQLSDAFEDCEVAAWFAESNRWLQGRIPLDVLGVDLNAVLCAARADRLGARPST